VLLGQSVIDFKGGGKVEEKPF